MNLYFNLRAKFNLMNIMVKNYYEIPMSCIICMGIYTLCIIEKWGPILKGILKCGWMIDDFIFINLKR